MLCVPGLPWLEGEALVQSLQYCVVIWWQGVDDRMRGGCWEGGPYAQAVGFVQVTLC